jgi:hypothetical protein
MESSLGSRGEDLRYSQAQPSVPRPPLTQSIGESLQVCDEMDKLLHEIEMRLVPRQSDQPRINNDPKIEIGVVDRAGQLFQRIQYLKSRLNTILSHI